VKARRSWPSQRGNLGGESRVEEERERQPRVAAEVADPVRRRPVPAAGQPVQHVADVADERAGDRRGLDPALRRGDLQAAAVVLGEQRQQPVVGVLADPPAGSLRRRRRVAEDPEQDGRIRGVPVREVPGVEAEAQRHPRQHRLAEAGQRVQVRQHDLPQQGDLAREQVAAVQRQAGQHPRVVLGQLGAEVEPFLQVRPPGGELAADREIAPPGPAAPRHGDLRLVRRGQGEELGARAGQLIEQLRGHAVAGHVEEAAVPARRLDLLRHRARGRPASDHSARAAASKRRHVDDRQRRRTCHALKAN
jgi:hypothetical protein